MSTLDPTVEQSLRDILQNVPYASVHEVLKCHPDYVEPKISWNNPEDYEFFAAVVGGQVLTVLPVAKTMMELTAAFSSNPKIIVLTNDQKNVIKYGWLYNQETGVFTEPDGGAPISSPFPAY